MGQYAQDDKLEWEKPDWTKNAPTQKSAVGEAARQGEDLAGDITNVAETADERGLGWEKPAWAQGGLKLKSTKKGEKLKAGETNLARPVTFPTGKTGFKGES